MERAGLGTKVPTSSAPSLHLFGVPRPWPNTEFPLLRASGAINPVRGKSNKQTADNHHFPRAASPALPRSSCQVSSTAAAWALHTAPRTPALLQSPSCGPWAPGLMHPSLCPGASELAGEAFPDHPGESHNHTVPSYHPIALNVI